MRQTIYRLAVGTCLTAALALCASTAGLTTGKAELKSAGPLAFGPDGILFVGDSVGAVVVAIDTKDNKAVKSAAKINITGINEKVASLLGTMPDQIVINDVKANPISKNVYLSVSRGKGPDAIPVIVKIDAAGKLSQLSLENVDHSSVALPDPPAENTSARRNPRLDTITDMAYVNGSVIIAGLSNEEFSSDLRSIPFPFKNEAKGASIEMYHGSHGRYETQSPVRTFVPYTIQNTQYVLAAYTCTPLVKIPVSELKAGAKVKGTTIAELGAGNQPLDMVPYRKDNHDYILLANSKRGVMKLSADNLEKYPSITAPTEPAGVPYTTLTELKGVQHLTKLDDSNALMLTDNAGAMNLETLPLP